MLKSNAYRLIDCGIFYGIGSYELINTL